MYGDRRDIQYQDGVKDFCRAALEHQRVSKAELIFCPCRDCDNGRKWENIKKIEEHLICRGFTSDYETWYWHGEELTSVGISNEREGNHGGLRDGNEGGNEDAGMEEDRMNEMLDAMGDHVTEQPRIFEDVSKAAETPLYPGCRKYSKLSGVLTLSNLKAKFGWTDTSFTSLLETLQDMFPDGNEIPKSSYYAKKLINPLGLEYTKIDACPNDCVLYRKDYDHLDECPVCGEPRYKLEEGAKQGKKKCLHVRSYGIFQSYRGSRDCFQLRRMLKTWCGTIKRGRRMD